MKKSIYTLTKQNYAENCTHFEELSQSDVVQSVGAVKDHTLLGHSFGQVFSCLGFSCASWALWGASQMEVEGTKQSAERGGEQTGKSSCNTLWHVSN